MSAKIPTKLERDEFKGQQIFKIFELRADNAPKDFPTFSFGVRKAKLLLQHVKDLEQFVKENDNGQS